MVEDMDIKSDSKDKVNNFVERQLVLFKIANEEFGVDINEVKEIIRWEEVTRIPNSEPYIKGVLNLRGNIIIVNDLAMKLGLPSKKVDDDTRIIVVEMKDKTVGMIVDSATEVLRLPGEKIHAAPAMINTNIDHSYIEGVGLLSEKRLLTLLDLAKVLESTDYQQVMPVPEILKDYKSNTDKEKDKSTISDHVETEDAENTEMPIEKENEITIKKPEKEKKLEPEGEIVQDSLDSKDDKLSDNTDKSLDKKIEDNKEDSQKIKEEKTKSKNKETTKNIKEKTE